MKKKLILLCLGVFLLCGCEMKEEATFTINKDKSMDLEVIIGLDDELIDTLISMDENEENDKFDSSSNEDEIIDVSEIIEHTDEERRQYLNESFLYNKNELNELKEEGYKLEEFQDEKYTGYKITKKVNNIDDLIGTPDFNLDDIDKIDNKKVFTKNGNIYQGKIIVGDPTEIKEDENASQYEINVIYNFTLKLPNKSISNNATTVSEDGKTLIWNLSSGNISTIEFEFEFPSILSFLKDNIILTAAIAVVIVLIIVIITTLILKKYKRNNSFSEVTMQINNQPVMQKNDSLTTIEQTQITKNPQIIGQGVNTQIPNQNVEMKVQEQIARPEINNMQLQAENINTNQNIQQQMPNIQKESTISQEQIINSINSIPVIQPNMEPVTLQKEVNTQTLTVNQSNNTQIPEIKPIVPEHINIEPIYQENPQPIEQQVVNTQFNQSMVSNEVLNQNITQQPESQNINKRQGI